MVIGLTCPTCGASWRSRAATGYTRCRACRTQLYIPANVRRAAVAEPGQLRYDPTTRRLTRVGGMVAHGTTSRYSGGCRCERCRGAIAAYRRGRRAEGKDGRTRRITRAA